MFLRLAAAAVSAALVLQAAAPPPVRQKAPVRKAPVRRVWRPPVVIPANYIVRPQLDELPPLLPPLPHLELRELSDSFAYRRFDGLIHWGIDIFRPAGEPLAAVVEGTVHLVENPRGGLTVSLVDVTGEFRFYYAHLSAYAPQLQDGDWVRAGDLLGFVGDTGNARGTRPHLHFEIHLLAPWLIDESGVLRGKAGLLNPCPVLRTWWRGRRNCWPRPS